MTADDYTIYNYVADFSISDPKGLPKYNHITPTVCNHSLIRPTALSHRSRPQRPLVMWPVVRRRRAPSPPFFNSYDALDLCRNFPTIDPIQPTFKYGYNNTYPLGLLPGECMTPAKAVEIAIRQHFSAQKDYEKAKEKYEEAKKTMEELETKMKQAEEMLNAARCSLMYGS